MVMKSTPHVDEITHGKVVELDLHGKLSRKDYEELGPTLDRHIREHGKIRILVTMHDFEGWDAQGLWEDIKWDAKHFNDVERIAIIGASTWHKWMAGFCNAFTTAKVRYFGFKEIDKAYVWLDEPQL